MTLAASAVGPQGYTKKYEATVESVPAARRDVGIILSTWHMEVLTGDAKQVTSELVTNVVDHAMSGCGINAIELEMVRLDCGVRIAIGDQCPKYPEVKEVTPTEERGRGLCLVSLLATDWGWTPQETGKQVWAELRF